MSLHTDVSSPHQLHFEPAREADHRIANSLASISSLVRMRARAAGDVIDVGTFLVEIADRIETVAKLHRLLASSNTGSVSIHDYLHEICERLGSALAPIPPSFSVTCPATHFVPFSTALPLGLITAELFSNSLKYAHPAGLPVKVSITCSRTAADELSLIYEDDGVGFPEGFDLLHDGHLGMRFIRTLSVQLNGAHKWLSDPLGVRFEITIPYE